LRPGSPGDALRCGLLTVSHPHEILHGPVLQVHALEANRLLPGPGPHCQGTVPAAWSRSPSPPEGYS
jgi:hypothetical protein